MKKQKNKKTLWIILLIGAMAIIISSFFFLTLDKETNLPILSIHYYENGREIYPTSSPSSVSTTTTITSPDFIESDSPNFLFMICIDLESPSAPSNLEITSSGQNIILTWNASTDEPSCSYIKHYVISRDSDIIASIDSLTFTDIDLPYGDYSYSVYAVDAVDHTGPSIKKDIVFSPSGIFNKIDYNEYDKISIDVSITNIGNVPITNLQIVDAYPIEFKNALLETTQSLANKESKILWNSSLIDSTNFESSQLFWINISGADYYTGEIAYGSSFTYLTRKGMEFTTMTSDKGTCGIVEDNWVCDISIYAGESYDLNLTLKNSGSSVSQPTLIETAISNFDGIGMSVSYLNPNLNGGIEFDIPYCIVGTTAYYYMGPPEGFIFPSGYSEDSIITIGTAINLMPGDYETNTDLILASERKCL